MRRARYTLAAWASAFCVVLLVAASLPETAAEDPTDWLRLDEAREHAASDGKPIFIFVEAEWCVQCRRMEREVFPQEDVKRLLEERYHAVSIDLDSREKVTLDGESVTEREFARRMEVSVTPTIFFMNAQGDVMGQRPGYVDVEEMTVLLRYVTSDSFGEISLEEFREQREQ